MERKRSGSQSNSRNSTANRRGSDSRRPSGLKDNEAILNAEEAQEAEKVTEEPTGATVMENGSAEKEEDIDEVPEEEEEEELEEDFNYDEDEFEDYDDDDFEEDLEEDADEEEEEEVNDVKMDSGNYDRRSMQHAASLQARMDQELREVKQAMLRENTAKGARSAARSDVKADETSAAEEEDEKEANDDTSVKRKRLKVCPASIFNSFDQIHFIFTLQSEIMWAPFSERESGRRLRQL